MAGSADWRAQRGLQRGQRMVWGWLGLGGAAFALLPWYYPQNLGLWAALRGALGGDDTASGLVQASLQGRLWLSLGPPQ